MLKGTTMLCLLLLIPFMAALMLPVCLDGPPRQRCRHDYHYQLVKGVADGGAATRPLRP